MDGGTGRAAQGWRTERQKGFFIIHLFFTPTIDLQIHPLLLRPGLIGRHAEVPAGVSHLGRVDV